MEGYRNKKDTLHIEKKRIRYQTRSYLNQLISNYIKDEEKNIQKTE